MSAERKAPSSKEAREALRRLYTWHLRPPFKDNFDSTHWWAQEGHPEIEPGAALYEIVRRHPSVGKEWRGESPVSEGWKGWRWGVGPVPFPGPLVWTCHYGLKCWAKLTPTERKNWEFGAGNIKGLDFRSQQFQCGCIQTAADTTIAQEREHALRKEGQSVDELISLFDKDLAANPPTEAERESAIIQRAMHAHRLGYVLLAVAPDLKREEAAKVLVSSYREYLKRYRPKQPIQRARWERWLPLVGAFDYTQVHWQKDGPQIFARYRRILDAIHFE